MEDTEGQQLPFLTKVVDFPEHGASYELLEPLTNYRVCHDGTPAEARIVFTCRQSVPDSQQNHHGDEEYIMKIKVQVAAPGSDRPENGPSTTTAAELKALQTFTEAKNPVAPHLVCHKRTQQVSSGPMPGGFMTFIVMTKMPGSSMFGRYWSAYVGSERDEIAQVFLEALKSIYALGIEPKDCALRNVLWEEETKKCSIIDFELWGESKERKFEDGKKELQKWGLAYRPVSKDWWAEWQVHMR
jgi:hypothetical protein